MKVLKSVLAYILGLLGWILGIFIGVIWNMIYVGYQESNVIDIPTLIAENVAPAIISVFLSNYIFRKIFPATNSKKLNIMIFYVIILLNYGVIISNTINSRNYSNFIYIITGVICVLYLMYKLQKESFEEQNIEPNENIDGSWDSFVEKHFKNDGEGTTIEEMKKNN